MGKRSHEALGETFPEENSKKRKKEGKDGKERKKRLRELKKDVVGLPQEEEEENVHVDAAENVEGGVLSKKAEKKKKKMMMQEKADESTEEGKENGVGAEAAAEQAQAEVPDDTKKEGAEQGEEGAEEARGGKKPRFIVFVGNLPYSATAESIKAHFAPLHPTSVRCLNKRDDPTKCRGCAFVEFSSSKSIRTCLDKWHHSTFDDGISKARKINIEMTAGGGGRKSNRMEKIKEKNAKLNEKRARRIEKEKKMKKEAEKESAEEDGGMHPSRKARMR
ncbi:hypothetical protein VUR80DRAFT_6378 [Thermomyces stellatus]